jgi:hypothetical protein
VTFLITQEEYDAQLRWFDENDKPLSKESFLKTYDVYYTPARFDLLMNLNERVKNATWTANV